MPKPGQPCHGYGQSPTHLGVTSDQLLHHYVGALKIIVIVSVPQNPINKAQVLPC